MSLPPPDERTPSHTRSISYECFRRADGAWDIDIRLTDVKAFTFNDLERPPVRPGEFVHDIAARVTVDTAMNVLRIETSMDAVPYSLCDNGALGAQQLVGANVARGWREALNRALGGTRGCTHLKEMLVGAATAAFQTISGEAERRQDGPPVPGYGLEGKPFYIDGCYSFSSSREVVGKYFPHLEKAESAD